MIAKEFYALQREVDRMERALQSATPEKREGLEEQLRKVRAERDRMKAMLEGNKEPSPYRKPR
jgi:hypothetical protein